METPDLQTLLSTLVPGTNFKDEPIEYSPPFEVAVQSITEEGVHIIIHPSGVNGDTLDYLVTGDTLKRL